MNNLDETSGDTQPNSDSDNSLDSTDPQTLAELESTDDDNQDANAADETDTIEEVTPPDDSSDEYEYNSEKMGMTPVVRNNDSEPSESVESADDGDSGNAS